MSTDIETLQKILKEDPSNFQARRELAILLANNGFNEEALSNLTYLSKYFPEDAEIWYNLGILQEKTKDINGAKISYQKAIEISPQEDFYYNYGEVLVELKEWNEAIDAFKTVLKTDTQDGNSYFNLGLCYYNKDEINLATDNFQKAIELNPKDIYALFYLGYIYQNNGLTNFAIENYNKILEILPDYSWAYFNLASIAYGNGNYEEARRYLFKTIEYNETDFEAYKLLTKICIKENEIEEIIETLQTRIKKEENGDLYYLLAQVYKHLGEKPQYIHCLNMALKNNLTLTYEHKIVKQELEYIKTQENIQENKIEEYESDEDTIDEEYDDFSEEDYEDFDINNTEENDEEE